VHVAIGRVQLLIPQSRSLKEKRAVVKPIVEGMRQRFAVSVAEVGFQDKWQRTLVGCAVVSESYGHAASVVDTIERWVWSNPEVEVASFDWQWVQDDE
jgi:uncharacterized protein YlxP (DUF503 family)